MAGAGYKLFNTGDVLTAAQVNTYLQEQAVMRFANAAARTTALSGVLAEGMVSYLQDTDAVEVYNGTAWVGIGSSGDITGVTAGTGLSGGGTSGDVTLSLSTPVSATNGGTAQTTYATGDLLYASASNTLAKRAIGTTGQVLTVSGGIPTWATPSSGTPTFVGCRARAVAGQSINNSTDTAVLFDTEDFDTDAFHSTSTNTSRFTIPTGKGGYYFISGTLAWPDNSAGNRQVKVYKNGTQVDGAQFTAPLGSSSASTYVTSTVILNLSAGDYIELYGRQNTGGGLTLNNYENSYIQLQYLGA